MMSILHEKLLLVQSQGLLLVPEQQMGVRLMELLQVLHEVLQKVDAPSGVLWVVVICAMAGVWCCCW